MHEYKEPTDQKSIDARKKLLAKTIRQPYMSQMQPELAVTNPDEVTSKPASQWKISWHSYAGMGDTMLNAVNAGTLKTARELIQMGMLVPTVQEEAYCGKFIPLQHFNDVAWGKKEDGTTVIIVTALNKDLGDTVIELDSSHAAASEELTRTFEHFKAMDYTPNVDMPVIIDGQKIYPIITDRAQARLRDRQVDANPGAFENIPGF